MRLRLFSWTGQSHPPRSQLRRSFSDALPRLRALLLRRSREPSLLALLLFVFVATLLLSRRPFPARRAKSGSASRLARPEVFSQLPVFLINGPEDYAARKWAEQQLALLNFSSYERLNGVVIEADDCQRLSGEGCQQGLALAHLAAWRRIAERQLPAALVLEDDVIWHKDFYSLLPDYLSRVPDDWQVVWLGQLRRAGLGTQPPVATGLLTTAGEAPWTLHAYLITWQAAELLASHYEFLLARVQSPHALKPFPYSAAAELQALPWHLSYRELKSDWYLGLAFHYFVPSHQKRLWVAFQSTRRHPAALGTRTWHDGESNELGRLGATKCTCEALGDERLCTAEEAQEKLPLMGEGLAYQNLCRFRRWALWNWVGLPGEAKPPSCAWLRERISQTAKSDESPHACVDDVYPAMARSLTPKQAVGGGNLE